MVVCILTKLTVVIFRFRFRFCLLPFRFGWIERNDFEQYVIFPLRCFCSHKKAPKGIVLLVEFLLESLAKSRPI